MTTSAGKGERDARLRRLIATEPDRDGGVIGLLSRVCRTADQELSAAGSGISVMTDGGLRGVSATSAPWVDQVEDLQFLLGEGPCISAFAEGRPILTDDLSLAGSRWPVYVPAARAGGVRAVFAFPLQIGAACLGVLDVFRFRTGPLTPEQLTTAFLLVDTALAAVLNYLEADDRGDDDAVQESLIDVGSRAQVFQAQGMVLVQLGVPLAEALLRMRAHAYVEGLSLEDVARAIVDRSLRFSPDGTQ